MDTILKKIILENVQRQAITLLDEFHCLSYSEILRLLNHRWFTGQLTAIW